MAHPRADALDALEHLACKLLAVAALMSAENVCLNEDEVFGLQIMFSRTAADIRQAKKKLEILIPAK